MLIAANLLAVVCRHVKAAKTAVATKAVGQLGSYTATQHCTTLLQPHAQLADKPLTESQKPYARVASSISPSI